MVDRLTRPSVAREGRCWAPTAPPGDRAGRTGTRTSPPARPCAAPMAAPNTAHSPVERREVRTRPSMSPARRRSAGRASRAPPHARCARSPRSPGRGIRGPSPPGCGLSRGRGAPGSRSRHSRRHPCAGCKRGSVLARGAANLSCGLTRTQGTRRSLPGRGIGAGSRLWSSSRRTCPWGCPPAEVLPSTSGGGHPRQRFRSHRCSLLRSFLPRGFLAEALLAQRFVRLTREPEPVEQHGQLARHGHGGALPRILRPTSACKDAQTPRSF